MVLSRAGLPIGWRLTGFQGRRPLARLGAIKGRRAQHGLAGTVQLNAISAEAEVDAASAQPPLLFVHGLYGWALCFIVPSCTLIT